MLSFKNYFAERYERLPKYLDHINLGVMVPLSHIQAWEPDENKSKYTIDQLKWGYRKYKETKDLKYLPDPIVLERNTGKIKLKSGEIIDTGNKRFVIWDGHHRLIAAREVGLDKINAKIKMSKTIGQQ